MKVLNEKLVRRCRCMGCYSLIEFNDWEVSSCIETVKYGFMQRKTRSYQVDFIICPKCGNVVNPFNTLEFSERVLVEDGQG